MCDFESVEILDAERRFLKDVQPCYQIGMIYTRSQGGLNKLILDVISEVTRWRVMAKKHERTAEDRRFQGKPGKRKC